VRGAHNVPQERKNVSDAITTARNARESLARGLNALQSDPNVPPALLELAAPIAQSMGALHQIERSGGVQLQPHADLALNNVRTALQALQAHPATHPAVAKAMEAVASSLGLVHSLSRMSAGAAPQAAPPQVVQPQAPHQYGAQAFAPTQAVPAQQGFPQQAPQARPQAPPQQAYVPPQAAAQQAYVPPQQQAYAPPQQAYAPPPQAAPQQAHAPQAPARPPSPSQTGEMPVVNADLGTHSPTNFYKGLSGNDIIDHGGLFVSTYMVPKIGTPVRLKVSLPGGYEFEANAVVAWSREASDAGYDAPPGFGAKFTQITQEARQLVYRYVRNREPLFHDDL
jgi:hypothetical protein